MLYGEEAWWAAMMGRSVEHLYLVGATTDKVYRRAGGYSGSAWDSGIAAPTGETNPTGIAFGP